MQNIEKNVLVGVIKDRRDLRALLNQKWYRIPVSHAPKRRFKYLAFYQPAGFGRRGKGILYYARVLGSRIVQRKDLLLDEPAHPRASHYYLMFRPGKIKKLPRPIRNKPPRRVSFGFTTLNRLLKSENILQLYNVAPTEEILKNALKRAGIRARAQYYVSSGDRRYYLDFAVFCRKGAVAIECDNKKAHAGIRQRERDKMKNRTLRRLGWTVIRFPEKAILSDLEGCVKKVKEAIRKLGGPAWG